MHCGFWPLSELCERTISCGGNSQVVYGRGTRLLLLMSSTDQDLKTFEEVDQPDLPAAAAALVSSVVSLTYASKV
jgi:amino acid permease